MRVIHSNPAIRHFGGLANQCFIGGMPYYYFINKSYKSVWSKNDDRIYCNFNCLLIINGDNNSCIIIDNLPYSRLSYCGVRVYLDIPIEKFRFFPQFHPYRTKHSSEKSKTFLVPIPSKPQRSWSDWVCQMSHGESPASMSVMSFATLTLPSWAYPKLPPMKISGVRN